MRQIVEVCWESLSKQGEELCGDSVRITTTNKTFTAVLSDGLGSGVKANILSTLTSQIAATMFEKQASTAQVMETLVETLPECQVRKLAYATLSMLKVRSGRHALLVEYDNPPLILIRGDDIVDLGGEERQLSGRRVREASFELKDGDYMLMLSDGYEHAGVGGLYRLGWGWQNIAVAARRWCQTGPTAYELCQAMKRTALKLYNGKPGDDATCIAMRVRPAVSATIWTGPPKNHEDDARVVRKFLSSAGTKAICGGTTAQIASRVLNKPLKVEWVPPSKRQGKTPRKKSAPPIAHLDGVDLVTEGILTLGQTSELLTDVRSTRELPHDNDAVTQLARILLGADDIRLIVGNALNPNQVADVIRGEPMRHQYVHKIIRELEDLKKNVVVEYV